VREDHVVGIFEQVAIALLADAQGGFSALSLDGIADRAPQERAVELPLHEVVGGAGPHGFEVDAIGGVPGEHDHRDRAARVRREVEQLDSALRAKAIVEQIQIVLVLANLFLGGFVGRGPIDVAAQVRDVFEHAADQQGVVFIVLG